MKIQTQQAKTADTTALNGNILTISGKDYDLSKPEPLEIIGTDEHGNDILESCENQQVYLDNNGDTIIFLRYSTPHTGFLFQETNFPAPTEEHPNRRLHGSNLLRFFDINGNGVIDLNELAEVIRVFNLPESELKEECRKKREAFFDQYDDEKEALQAWRMKGVIQ